MKLKILKLKHTENGSLYVFKIGQRPRIIITDILKVFEDYEYIEGLREKLAEIKHFYKTPALSAAK